jgi:hypothetical protein
MTENKTPMTYAEAVEMVAKAIEERGEEYVYRPGFDEFGSENGCSYVSETYASNAIVTDEMLAELKPGCIMGVALILMGAAEMRQLATCGDHIGGLLVDLQIPTTRKALHYLTKVQKLQDDKTPWGRAHELAANSAEFVYGESEHMPVLNMGVDF